MKIHDLSAQHIFPSKEYIYTTYECIPELVVTVPSVRTTIDKKIKRFIIWLYKWSRVTFTELLSAVVKILTLSSFSMTFPWLSMTFAIFHDFPGLENGLPKFYDFPWPGGTLTHVSTLVTTLSYSLKSVTYVHYYMYTLVQLNSLDTFTLNSKQINARSLTNPFHILM